MTKFVWATIFFIISIIPILTGIRVVTLQQSYKTAQLKKENFEQYTERGLIFDRNGNILAMQIDSWNVGFRPIDIKNKFETYPILAQILNIPIKTLEEKTKDNDKYVRIKKFIEKDEYDALHAYQLEDKLQGVQVNKIAWRRYPGNDSLSHLIGYYGENSYGLDGIEASYDSYLSPSKKSSIGNSVYLTIDSVLQKSIEEIVQETLDASKSSYITTILMDAKTGDILAYVDEPGFDLNKYYTYSQEMLSNKIITNTYEPGSVFKVFSMASALDNGVIDEYTMFDARGPYVDPDNKFVINDVMYPGIISTSEIIKFSSNVGVSLATYNMDPHVLYRYLRNFGFGSKTGINLLGENSGVFYGPDTWSARSKQTIALGQEIAVTAMQVITAATALANDGVMLKPNFVARISDEAGNTLYTHTPEYGMQVIRKDVAHSILNMMKSATEGGTAHRMRINGINISAKTGTAQVFDLKKNEYSKTDFIASTLGIVPTENPKLIVYSVIHKPTSGEVYGGRTTAPMIRKMLEFILPYLGLVGTQVVNENSSTGFASEGTKTNSESAMANVVSENSSLHTNLSNQSDFYGDYTGLSKQEILSIFSGVDIRVVMEGNGKVVSQDPLPGSRINNKSISLLFN